MVSHNKMPDASALREARCQHEGCNMLLAKVRLTVESIVEIKCRRCNKVNTFSIEQEEDDVAINLVPDGQGGYIPPEY
jgi:phage FluMu protein Com